MNTEKKTALIIGATVSGLIVAKTIAGLFDRVLVVENNSQESLTGKASQYVSGLASFARIEMMFSSHICGYVMNTRGNLTGVSVQSQYSGLEIMRADVVIDASGIESRTPLFLQCLGYEAVKCTEKSLVISSSYTQTVTIQSYNYHKMGSLPEGLFVIGDGVNNIAQVVGQEDKIATIQATVLKGYLASNKDNLKFQKNIAYLAAILIQEYASNAKQAIREEHHLVTRGKFAMSSS